MTDPTSGPMAEQNGWLAATLRMTAFLDFAQAADPETWWQAAMEAEPDTSTHDRRQATHQLAAVVKAGRVALVSQPARVDWLYFARWDDATGAGADLLPSEPVDAALAPFSEWTKRWLALGVPTQRLAFAAVLGQNTASKESGYERLAAYLPAVQLTPTGASDFLYQINRPRESRVLPGLRINRLGKWSVSAFTIEQFNFGPEQAAVRRIAEISHALRVELDINTAGDRAEVIPSSEIIHLYDELIAMGLEIATNGDIP